MHTRYFQAGGLAEDIPRGFFPECAQVRASGCRRRSTSTRRSSTATRSGSSERRGIGLLSADDAIALGQSGPVLRASGVDWDLRRDQPYLAYDRGRLPTCPSTPNGDVYDRYRVHMDEMRESTRIVAQCLDRLEGMEGEPWIADDRKVVLPPRAGAPHLDGVADPPLQDRHRGLPRARGRGLRRRSSRRAASSAATSSPTAGRSRGASSSARPRSSRCEATATCMRDALVADMIAIVGSLDTRHGRGRPVSAFYDEIQRGRRAVPGRALGGAARRCGSRRSGTAAGSRRRRSLEVAEALDLTPAHVQAVASFYDMFHLGPSGEHVVEVCTNVSCALVGAQQVRRGVRGGARRPPGETSEDGEVTLRDDRVRRRLRLRAGRRRSTTATASPCARGRARDRRGAAQWLTSCRSSSRAPTSAT